MSRFLLILPLVVFGVVGIFLTKGLSLDQSKQPSYLIDKPVPDVELVDMPGLGEAFGGPDLRDGEVKLVNVFGSWCAGCRIEHPLLMEIGAGNEVPLYGIDWADTPTRGAEWLEAFGNPFDRVGNDENGRAAIEFGVTGAPETFVIDGEGRIRHRHVGPLSRETWEKSLKPMVQALQEEARAGVSASTGGN